MQWIGNEFLYLAQWIVTYKYKSSTESLPEGILSSSLQWGFLEFARLHRGNIIWSISRILLSEVKKKDKDREEEYWESKLCRSW